MDYNEFRNKTKGGVMLDVTETKVDGQVLQRTLIHHNYFHDFTSLGDIDTITISAAGLG